MKTILTLFFLLSTVFCFAQTSTSFRTGVAGFAYNSFYDAVELSDGSFVCVGYAENETETEDSSFVYLAKLNSTGKVIAGKSIFGDILGFTEGIDIIKTSDGNLAVTGILNNQIALFKFDTNLNLLWYKEYVSSTDYGYGVRLIQAADGGYMIAGYVENYSSTLGYTDAGCVLKTTSDGSLSWLKQYFELGDNYITDIVSTTDGNYAFLASSYSNSSETLDTSYVVKINSSGTVIWSKYLSTSVLDQDATTMIPTSDGGLVVSGSIDRFVNRNGTEFHITQPMMFKLDQNGSLLWSKASDNNLIADIYLWGVTEDKDGGYVATGQYYLPDSQNQPGIEAGYMMKVNSSGTLQWTKQFSDLNIDGYFYNPLTSADGSMVVAGGAYNNNLNLGYGSLYKFTTSYGICGESGSVGNFVDLNGSLVSKNLSVTTLSALVSNDDITMSSLGAGGTCVPCFRCSCYRLTQRCKTKA